jgi:chromosome segregation ATPase
MKNFQVTLLVLLAFGLCGLCVYQWNTETLQRNEVQRLNTLLSQKVAAIQDYTNSIANTDRQVAQMDARLTEFKAVAKSNDQALASQRLELNALRLTGEVLTNEITQYSNAVATLQAKLAEAYAGIKKQNDAISNLVAQRDDFVRKYNAEVMDRNNIVSNYNTLADEVRKMQKAAAKQ